MEGVRKLESPALASTLLAFETDLAEHYSQISSYMRLLGMVPPSALPQKARVAIELPASALSPYIGVYELASGLELGVTLQNGALHIRSSIGGAAVQFWRSEEHTSELQSPCNLVCRLLLGKQN